MTDADISHLSIGEVLSLLQDEFPDVTISKIRFLESQGLIDPERTPSGYRKFYEADVERLREAGLGDADILHLVEVVGYYAFVNRIADGLGVELE